MNRSVSRVVRHLPLALVAGFVATMSVAVDAKELRLWNIHPDGHPNTEALKMFADEVAEKTDGDITVKLFNGGVLGSQPDAIEQVRLGALDFGQFNLGPMGTSVPVTNVVSLPFIFKDIPSMYKEMDGDIGDQIAEGMAEKGIVALSWFDAGARSFYNSTRPINKPEDVAGLKIRVMNNDLFVQMIAEMGGNATPMAYSEVLQSLQTGVVDGAENNPPSFDTSSHYEAVKYYSLTEHLIIPECVCMAKTSWDALTPEQQDEVKTAARDAADEQRKLWTVGQKESLAKVEAAGVEVNTVEDKTPFQEAMKPVYENFLAANPDLVSLVEEMQAAE